MPLVHDELRASRGRAPVDRAHPVSRREQAEIRELQTLAFLARDLVAREHLSRDRLDDLLQGLGQRVDPERLPAVELRLPDEQPEPVARA